MTYKPVDPSALDIKYVAWHYAQGHGPNNTAIEHDVLALEFQQWLAEYTRQQREEVWGQGYADGQDSIYTAVDEWPNPDIKNPYRSESCD